MIPPRRPRPARPRAPGRISRLRARAAALLLLLVLPAAARAQSGAIDGRVVAAGSGAPIGEAIVLVRGTRHGAQTAADGHFRIAALPAGRHTVVAQVIGRAPDSARVEVAEGATATVTLRLAERATVLAPTVVSATREAQRRTDASATIDVLDGAALRDARAAHPSAVMKRIPGVHVSQLSGEGHSTAIRQPITTKPLYLYLEDGIPTRSTGFFNHNALYEVNLPQAGGLEVLKGPGTALYGSDAIGGVVNALTRPAPAVPTLEAALEGGSNGYARLLATGGFARGRSGVRVDANLTTSDGWRDASPYDRRSATVRWDHAAANGITARTVIAGSMVDQRELATLDATRFAARPELNPSPIGYREVEALRISTAIEREGERSLWSLTPFARHNVLRLLPTWQLTYDPQVWDTRSRSLGLLAKYRRDFAPLDARVIVGADVDWTPGRAAVDGILPVRAGADSAWTSYTVTGRQYDYDVTHRQASPYVHAELTPVRGVRIDAGLRYDASAYAYDSRLPALETGRWRRPADTTVRYTRLSPKLGITWDARPGLNVYASYREGFRAPGQSQLFQPGSNANTVALDPVVATSVEGGVRGELGARLVYSVAAYDMRIRDDILGVLDASGTRIVSNAGETSHRGVEVGVGALVTSALRVDASWAAARHCYERWAIPVQGQNVSYAGRTIEGAPGSLANVLLTWTPPALGGGRLAAEWSHTGSYQMDPENTRQDDGSRLVTLHASWVVGGRAELFGRLVNATNERYAELASYNAFQREQYTPGAPRALYAGMRYTWEGGR